MLKALLELNVPCKWCYSWCKRYSHPQELQRRIRLSWDLRMHGESSRTSQSALSHHKVLWNSKEKKPRKVKPAMEAWASPFQSKPYLMSETCKDQQFITKKKKKPWRGWNLAAGPKRSWKDRWWDTPSPDGWLRSSSKLFVYTMFVWGPSRDTVVLHECFG